MNDALGNENATGQGGVIDKAKNLPAQSIKKIDRVIAALQHPKGLNRFEAERIGEHSINSTVAVIRARYGSRLTQQWETVKTRYCSDGVRVLRYWLAKSDGSR